MAPRTYAHLPTWKKRLPGRLVGCGIVGFYVVLVVVSTAVAIDEPAAGGTTFQVLFVGFHLLVLVFAWTPWARRLAGPLRRMGGEGTVEAVEARVDKLLRLEARGSDALWAEHHGLSGRWRRLPAEADEDLRARYDHALERLTTAAVDDPDGRRFRQRRLAWRTAGLSIVAASVLWALAIERAIPGADAAHFLPWPVATAGFATALRYAPPLVRWVGSSLFGLIAIVLPALLVP